MTPDQAPTRPPALRFLLPSARDLIFILLFCSLLAGPLSNRPLADPDIGWHIRAGEQMVAARSIPRTDSFSSTMHGRPWVAWEWLYDAALGILHRAMGLNGVVWLAALVMATTLTLLLWQLLKSGTGLPLAILLMLLAESAAAIHMFARPHIVSWLLTLAWFIALERWEQGNAPPWLRWFFPVSMMLWVNLHGGWLFGITLLVIYTFAAFVESLRAADAITRIGAAKRARAMGSAFAWSALATVANPYGWRLHAHIYRYLSDRYLMNRIVEFRSPDFHGWPQRSFAVIVVLVLIAFAGRRRQVRLSHTLVTLLAVYAGLFATRNLPVSSMLLVLVAGPILWESLVALAERPGAWSVVRHGAARVSAFAARMGEQELELRGHLWPALAVAGALAMCLHGGSFASRQLIHAQFDAKHVPVAAAEFLAQEGSREPIFAPDWWGGFLIYRLYSERQVVIDDRHDLYGTARFREYLTLIQGEPGWKNVLEQWQIQTVLLPAGETLANLLREFPEEWQPVYEDKVAVVFEKRR
ncbi:MAG: hypothetical protein ACHP7J_01655 [Terriglobales bacterium]